MKKNILANFIFKLLVKGINGANLYDTRVQKETAGLPQDFVVSLGIFPYGEYVKFRVNADHVCRIKDDTPADLEIVFKNNSVANAVVLGRKSVAKTFAEHAILLKGDIYKAMALVRIINLVENYLFPKWFTNKIYRYKKQCSSLKMYFYVLFGRSGKRLKERKYEK